MWRDSLLRRYVAIGLSVCFAFQVTGCSSWTSQTQPPAEVLTKKSVTLIRVTMVDGARMYVHDPHVVNDTLTGYRLPASEKNRGEQLAIPTSEIRYIEVYKTETGKTILLVAGISLAVLLIAVAATDPWGNWGSGGSDTASCPLVYSWDGTTWRLDSGTFGGAVMPALQRTDLDNLVYARPEHGRLRLRLANELQETDYVDAVSVLAVDHPPDASVLPDASGKPLLYVVRAAVRPTTAQNDAGDDVLSRVRASDDRVWESGLRQRDPSHPTERRDGIVVTFARPVDSQAAGLVIEARNTPWASYLMGRLARAWGRDITRWYDPVTAATSGRRVGTPLAEHGALTVQVRVNGAWERKGEVLEIGPELSKRVVLPLDLSAVPGDRIEIRLESIPSLWMVDYVGLGALAPAGDLTRELPLEQARRADGEDVRPRLAAEDGDYWIMQRGDVAELSVPVPPVPAGLRRSYVLKSSGWYRLPGADTAAADTALLRAFASPDGPAILAVEAANDALARLR
jgi:hypothetical protein